MTSASSAGGAPLIFLRPSTSKPPVFPFSPPMTDPPVASTSAHQSTPSTHSHTPPPASPLPSLLRIAHGPRVSHARLSNASVSLGVGQNEWEGAPGPPERKLKRATSSAVLRPSTPVAAVEEEPGVKAVRTVVEEEVEEERAEESGDESDASSGFANLLSRVVGGSSSASSGAPPSLGRDKGKGKAREGDVTSLEDAPGLLDVGAEQVDVEEDDEEEEGEVVGREEGQADPRDMLREQLRKNEVRGKDRRRSQSVQTGERDRATTMSTRADNSFCSRSCEFR